CARGGGKWTFDYW
nr:immunoglobulin heavy chain junction region [Mus musculus]MBK4183965.1 immunoglobulin heavy chain junction region [Mus musculus]MBK4183966.1 immunoglobulin heavy chain junction region [Mus musculus]MBK4183967.1 immunoglobulin heavy chain junction region [Mus musculus]MBK4183968.1 immunoglobulin heavy chain junction region [Mus musculus]